MDLDQNFPQVNDQCIQSASTNEKKKHHFRKELRLNSMPMSREGHAEHRILLIEQQSNENIPGEGDSPTLGKQCKRSITLKAVRMSRKIAANAGPNGILNSSNNKEETKDSFTQEMTNHEVVIQELAN